MNQECSHLLNLPRVRAFSFAFALHTVHNLAVISHDWPAMMYQTGDVYNAFAPARRFCYSYVWFYSLLVQINTIRLGYVISNPFYCNRRLPITPRDWHDARGDRRTKLRVERQVRSMCVGLGYHRLSACPKAPANFLMKAISFAALHDPLSMVV